MLPLDRFPISLHNSPILLLILIFSTDVDLPISSYSPSISSDKLLFPPGFPRPKGVII